MFNLAAVILAGGLSRRMGQDKALLEIQGVSMLRRTWDIARAVTPTVWVVTSKIDVYRPHLPATAQWIAEATPASDAAPPGPLVAFAEALKQLDAEWVLLLPCDLPGLQALVLQHWQQTLPMLPMETIAYLPRTSQGWEPLCGFYRTTCLPELQTYVAGGGRSFQQWLEIQPVQIIPDVPPEMLVNCNTPEDWVTYGFSRFG